MPRVRNYVRTGEGPNNWMVITMAEQTADVLERLAGRCDSCDARVAMTPDPPPAFVLLSGSSAVAPALPSSDSQTYQAQATSLPETVRGGQASRRRG